MDKLSPDSVNFKGKKVLIIGLGRLGGGEGMVRFFAEQGARVTVTDLKNETELKETIDRLRGLPITYVLGHHRFEDFKNQDLIIRNPDVPQNSGFLKEARKNNIPVEMDESLFLKLCLVPVIGVTGTRGKTTTTTLIGEVLKAAGYSTLLGGNLQGVTTLNLLKKIKQGTKVVLELSSWQLQGLGQDKISPHIAVITNIYPDHLNRYENMTDYINDKKLIFKYQDSDDFLILNEENETTKSFANEAKSKVNWFKKSIWPNEWSLKLLGDHNRENAAAALAACRILGINDETIRQAVGQFTGVKFRLEEVRKYDGVTYINDTTSTTPIAGIAALNSFYPKSIILIAGGSSKNLDLSDFAKEIVDKAKAVILLDGSATDDLESKIQREEARRGIDSKILGRCNNLEKAILTAKKKAKSDNVVLFSPGCTSFGMFKNEFDRGRQFEKIVKNLP